MARLVLACTLAACGHIGFDGSHQPVVGTDGASADGAPSSGGGSDGGGDGGAANGVAYVKALAQQYPGMGATDSFTLQADRAGDAVVFMAACAGSMTPTSIAVTAPGWTIAPWSPMTIDSPAQISGASFVALAPDTSPATVSVTWASTNCNRGKTELVDEFTGNDTTSPSAAFDAHAEAPGTGNATTTITTGHANDAVWGAVYSATMATAIGSGFTAAATDGNGDFAEYALTTDPAGTVETVTFANPNGFVVVATTIAPAP